MKKYLSALLALSLVTISSQSSAAAAEPEAVGDLLVAANQPLNQAATWTEGFTSAPIEILDQKGTLSTVAVGEEAALLSTNASTSANNVAAALATSTEISLAWDFQDAEQVNVLLDGELLGIETNEGSMSVPGVAVTEESRVTFSQLKEATDEDQQTTFAIVELPLAQPEQSTLLSATQTLALATVAPPAATVLRYQTFIKPAYIDAPDAGCLASTLPGDDYSFSYKGNNRDYLAGSSNNKTAFQANISWGAEVATANISVAKTEVYTWVNGVGYVFLYERQPSKSGITLTNGTFYSNSVYIHMHHDVANPDCLFASGIYYDIKGKIYRTGGYALTGEYREAPWHEFYIKDSNNTTWQMIYRSDLNSLWGFYCFLPSVIGIDYCIKRDSWDESYSAWYHPPA